VFSVEILSDHELKILFLGKDDVMYFANIDFAGNFLTEPVTA